MKLSSILTEEYTDADHKKHKEWRAKNKDKVSAQNKRHAEKHPKQNSARQATYRQRQEEGNKKRTCARDGCDKTSDLIAHHHKGYDGENKKKVQYFCRQHHDHNNSGHHTDPTK